MYMAFCTLLLFILSASGLHPPPHLTTSSSSSFRHVPLHTSSSSSSSSSSSRSFPLKASSADQSHDIPSSLPRKPHLKVLPIPAKLLSSQLPRSKVNAIAADLALWRSLLKKGIVPDKEVWPPEPLFSELTQTLYKLEVPQLIHRHKELVEPMISAIVDLGLAMEKLEEEEEEKNGGENEEEEEENEWNDEEEEGGDGNSSNGSSDSSIKDKKASEMAAALMRGFESKWSPALSGIATLDEVLGADNDISSNLDSLLPSQDGSGNEKSTSFSSSVGLSDGMWQHVGWTQMKTLQTRVSKMKQLKTLIYNLGRRPSSTGKFKMKYPPYKYNKDAPLSVSRNPLMPTNLNGLCFSANLQNMLTRDAMLLRGSNKLRRLFLAKYAQQGLLSYEFSDWADDTAFPIPTKRIYSTRLPTAVGGPIIICIDTSGSMQGPRETLAKAVVLECASMAAKFKRDCYVLAFSGQSNLAECDLKLSHDKDGLIRLLDFLAYTFRGGTDVEAPLKRAMELMLQAEWAAADVVLVTDGELMMPPLEKSAMEHLEQLKKEKQLRVHGLLVGQQSSLPLDLLCSNGDAENRVHTFLNDYETTFYSSAASASPFSKSPNRASASASILSDKDRSSRGRGVPGRGRLGMRLFSVSDTSGADVLEVGGNDEDFVAKANQWAAQLREAVKAKILSEASSSPSSLSEEYDKRAVDRRLLLQRAINALERGLIERSVEVRLLILAVLSGEHVLLLGPPGTGKSEVGRRLSLLNNGRFFERLLTRYTQPEELFGPFSLKALENDQFVRNTDGFLPTADIAFIDEIFKANSAILNTLLTVLNERKFDNGNKRFTVPLIALIGASNELPDSDELEALYDRFIFRKMVNPISDDNIMDLLLQNDVDYKEDEEEDAIYSLGLEALAMECRADAGRIRLSEEVLDLLVRLRSYLRDELVPPIYCSDRRLKKAVKALTIAAAAQGRGYVSLVDTFLLQYIMWSRPGDESPLKTWLMTNIISEIDSRGLEFIIGNSYLSIEVAVKKDDVDTINEQITFFREDYIPLAARKAVQFDRLVRELSGLEDDRIGPMTNLWLDELDVAALRQQLLPKAKLALEHYEEILNKASTVAVVMEAYMASRDQVNIEEISNTLMASIDCGRPQEDDSIESNQFTPSEMRMTKREAQKVLSPDRFKAWKKEIRASKGASNNDEEDDA